MKRTKPAHKVVQPNGLTGRERTPVSVAQSLEAVAGRIRQEQPPIGTAVRWILRVAADAMVDAAIAVEFGE